jgi:hypothetical protein
MNIRQELYNSNDFELNTQQNVCVTQAEGRDGTQHTGCKI